MARSRYVMVTAVILAVVVMLIFSGKIADFIERRPTIKILALAFLLLIGVTLVIEGCGGHVSKGYIYFAMAFSLGVEMLNLKMRKHEPVRLRDSHPRDEISTAVAASVSRSACFPRSRRRRAAVLGEGRRLAAGVETPARTARRTPRRCSGALRTPDWRWSSAPRRCSRSAGRRERRRPRQDRADGRRGGCGSRRRAWRSSTRRRRDHLPARGEADSPGATRPSRRGRASRQTRSTR
jgi:hypothetical protein